MMMAAYFRVWLWSTAAVVILLVIGQSCSMGCDETSATDNDLTSVLVKTFYHTDVEQVQTYNVITIQLGRPYGVA